jgi:hypothetical protein
MLRLGKVAPMAGAAILRRILEDLGLQATHPLMNGLFQFLKGGLGMGCSPLFHFCQHRFAQSPPGTIYFFVHTCLLILRKHSNY